MDAEAFAPVRTGESGPEPEAFLDPPGWYILSKATALRRAPIAVRVGGRQFVAFRTEQGRLGVLADRCAHRGAPLSAGSVCGEHVKCPYHGWEYGIDGDLGLIPAMTQRPENWPALKLPAIECVEQDGYAWARFGRPAADAPHRFRHLGQRGWTSFGMQTRFRATVESCLENFLDCPHATFVHKYWFRAPTAEPVKCVVRTLPNGAEAEYFDEPRKKSAVWWLLAPRKGTMRHVDRFIAPHTSEVEYEFPGGLHYIITSSCTPLSARETMVHTVISFRFRWLGPIVRLFFEPLSRWIIRQDVRMLDQCQENAAHADGPAFVSTPADLLGPHIRAWRRAAMMNTAPPAAGTETCVDITL